MFGVYQCGRDYYSSPLHLDPVNAILSDRYFEAEPWPHELDKPTGVFDSVMPLLLSCVLTLPPPDPDMTLPTPSEIPYLDALTRISDEMQTILFAHLPVICNASEQCHLANGNKAQHRLRWDETASVVEDALAKDGSRISKHLERVIPLARNARFDADTARDPSQKRIWIRVADTNCPEWDISDRTQAIRFKAEREAFLEAWEDRESNGSPLKWTVEAQRKEAAYLSVKKRHGELEQSDI